MVHEGAGMKMFEDRKSNYLSGCASINDKLCEKKYFAISDTLKSLMKRAFCSFNPKDEGKGCPLLTYGADVVIKIVAVWSNE